MFNEQKIGKILLTIAVLFVCVIFVGCVKAQKQGNDMLRFMFYNVENFFDTTKDPAINDNDFLPDGSMRWTQKRYLDKRNRIARVITNVGEWDAPALVGLCEIENRGVLDDLIRNTPLSKYPYSIVHKESPDPRGIDVALLYRSDYLKCIAQQFIHVKFPDNSRRRTRDILYAAFLVSNGDTLHVFVNHWPSRSGGQKQSEPGRILTASIVRQKVDSIFSRNSMANIIVAGDLNDTPLDKSLTSNVALHALTDTSLAKPSALFNLSAYKMNEPIGTIKYQGKWDIYDQIIVSGGLLRGDLRTDVDLCHIFKPDYLLEFDRRYMGVKPFRTYVGMNYINGFSDHLPVYVDIMINNDKK